METSELSITEEADADTDLCRYRVAMYLSHDVALSCATSILVPPRFFVFRL